MVPGRLPVVHQLLITRQSRSGNDTAALLGGRCASAEVGGGGDGRASLAALLHVPAHELLGVLLEDLIDFVEQLVELGLDLLALLARRAGLFDDLIGLRRGLALLLFSLSHSGLVAP